MTRKMEPDIACERKGLCGETDEVSTTIFQTSIEGLTKLCQDYEPRNMLSLDELGYYSSKYYQRKI